MTLHLIQRSPFSNSALQDCLNTLDSQDSILLMQDGVYGLNHPLLSNTQVTTYALLDDLNARGLDAKNAIKNIEYPEFVALCTSHKHVISWY